MKFRINKIDSLNVEKQVQHLKNRGSENELIFPADGNKSDEIYTKETANILFQKILNDKRKMSLFEKASILTDDENINATKISEVKNTNLVKPLEEIKEAITLNSSDGEKFYLIQYKDGSVQTIYPDNTSVYKITSRDDEYFEDYNQYFYDGYNLTKFTAVWHDKIENKVETNTFIPDENGNFTGYAKEGETLKDVLKNLGIKENTPEAENFLELNANNIKTYGPNKVKAFEVGSKIVIPQELAIECKYIIPPDESEWQISKYQDKIHDEVSSNIYYTTQITIDSDKNWWNISKENLQREHGIKKPTDAQIQKNMYVLKEINDNNIIMLSQVEKGTTITVTDKVSEDIPAKFLLQSYLPNNLKQLYPDDKYKIVHLDTYLLDENYGFKILDKFSNEEVVSITYDTIRSNYRHKEIKTGVHVKGYNYHLDIDANGNAKEITLINKDYWLKTGYDKAGNKEVTKPVNPKYKEFGEETTKYDKNGNITEHTITQERVDLYLENLVKMVKNNDSQLLQYAKHNFSNYIRIRLETFQETYDIIKNSDADYILKSKALEKIKDLENQAKGGTPKYLETLCDLVKNNDMTALTHLQKSIHNENMHFHLEDLSHTYDKIKEMNVSYTLKSQVLEKLTQLAEKETTIKTPKDNWDFRFKLNGEKLTIKNRIKNTEHIIDFDKLLEEFTPIERIYLKEEILKMNPQAIEDLSIEIKKLKKQDLFNGHCYYNPLNNTINIPPQRIFNSRMSNITHELGHAVDCNGFINISPIIRTKYIKLFIENLKKFLADGNNKHSYVNEYAKKWFPKTFKNLKSGNAYSSENMFEMFAECYAYIMNGRTDTTKKEILEKYFSENVEMTHQILNEIREMPDEKRCRAMTDVPKDLFKQFYNTINIPPELGF